MGDEILYREMKMRFGKYFEGAMGAEAIQKRLQTFDLVAESESLRETIHTGKGQRKTRALKRLKVVSAFLTTTNSPEGMVLDCVRVIPPDLRRWFSSTVAGSPRPTSTTSTVASSTGTTG